MKKIKVKLVIAISLDGKIALRDGGASHLGNKGDRKVLETALSWADATLMGGETLRQHKNTCLIHDDELIKARIKEGRTTQPISIIISKQKEYPKEFPYFKQPITRWLINSETQTTHIYPKNSYEKVINFQSNWSKTFALLDQKGIERLLILGGAKLIGSLLAEDQISEIQLTITPKIIGGSYSWVSNDNNHIPQNLALKNAWVLKETKKLSDNEIMLNYMRNKS